jgi:ComF family protein
MPLDTPVADPAAVCAHCEVRPSPFRRCVAPFRYEFPLTDLVPALKYEGHLTHARVLGNLLAAHVAKLDASHDVDRIVPMPLHVSRLLTRGFNQSYEIARFVSGRPGTALDPRALRRTRATVPQVGLARQHRRRNVRGAFAADAVRVSGLRIALLDDVVTTASTVEAAAGALLDAGARHVDVWCVARAAGAAGFEPGPVR